jgi:mono/diheme cytochrome c family protein
VQLFDLLGGLDGSLNQQRIVDELTVHRIAPGSVPIDVRPVALAIVSGCLTRANISTAITGGRLGFFRARQRDLTFDDIFNDTSDRARNLPRRKADLERMNLDRINPGNQQRTVHLYLLQQYGMTSSLNRLRQEVFRRPTTVESFSADSAVMGGVYVDREDYDFLGVFNTEKVALYRYFLEPLGVSVDKWSMGVRGRSRSYAFADVFKDSPYVNTFTTGLTASLTADPYPDFGSPPRRLTAPFGCTDLLAAVNDSFSMLDPTGGGATPTYTDVQRIFNKSCVECHGGLLYPPYRNFVGLPVPSDPMDRFIPLDLSEEEYPPRYGRRRMQRSYINAVARVSSPAETSQIFRRITNPLEDCPGGLMPCAGPALSQADIKTILRWIEGAPAIQKAILTSEPSTESLTIFKVRVNLCSCAVKTWKSRCARFRLTPGLLLVRMNTPDSARASA